MVVILAILFDFDQSRVWQVVSPAVSEILSVLFMISQGGAEGKQAAGKFTENTYLSQDFHV